MQNKSKLHTFLINYVSEDTGEEFNGQFTCRRQTILDKSRIQRRKSELSGGMYCVKDENDNPTGQGIDEDSEWFNYAIAVVETVLESKPEWFDFQDLADEGVVLTVYKEVMNFDNSFRKRTGGTDSSGGRVAGSAEDSTPEHKETIHGGVPPKVVDGEVQASLD